MKEKDYEMKYGIENPISSEQIVDIYKDALCYSMDNSKNAAVAAICAEVLVRRRIDC